MVSTLAPRNNPIDPPISPGTHHDLDPEVKENDLDIHFSYRIATGDSIFSMPGRLTENKARRAD